VVAYPFLPSARTAGRANTPPAIRLPTIVWCRAVFNSYYCTAAGAHPYYAFSVTCIWDARRVCCQRGPFRLPIRAALLSARVCTARVLDKRVAYF